MHNNERMIPLDLALLRGEGITCCLLLFLRVRDELSCDRFHGNVERIYRVIQQYEADGKTDYSAKIPVPLAPESIKDFPGIQKTSTLPKMTVLKKIRD